MIKMTENTENTITDKKSEKKRKKKRYLLFMAVVIILVSLMDAFVTPLPGTLQSSISAEFLGGLPVNTQDMILAFGSAFFSVGLWFVFFFQYYSDKYGRKNLLFVTVIGISLALIGVVLSSNYFMYIIFMLFLSFFFNSDIWMIYVNESVKMKKRVKYTYYVLLFGVFGSLLMNINRMIFIANPNPIGWRGITLFPMLLGIPLSIVIMLKLKESPKFESVKSYSAKKSFKQGILECFKIDERKAFKAVLLISFIFGLAVSTSLTMVEKYVTNTGNITQLEFTGAQTVVIISVIIAFGGNSYLLDKVGRKPMMYIYSTLTPIALIGVVISATLPSGTAISVFTVLLMILNIAFWGLNTLLRIYTLELVPTKQRGTSLGLRSFSFAFGGTVGLLLSGPLILVISLGPTMILLSIVLFTILPIIWKHVKETKGVDIFQVK